MDLLVLERLFWLELLPVKWTVSSSKLLPPPSSTSHRNKYIGESARVIREMFAYAKDNQPCIIFMDEIDAIGGKRLAEGSSADREIQRTLMELLNQLDGFEDLGRVKCVMATNRPVTLYHKLLRLNLSLHE